MPTYEYRCDACDYNFEINATMDEKKQGLEIVCEKCGSKNVRQLFRGFSMMKRGKSDQSGCGNGGSCCG